MRLHPRGLAGPVLMVSVLAGLLVFWIHFEPTVFADWKREAGPVPFFIGLALLPAIGVPPTPFFILAGATFSVWVNLLGIALALAVNVALSYAIAHRLLRAWTERLLDRARVRLLDHGGRNALRYALLIKLAPGVPMALKNYLVALCGVSFAQYFAVCFGISAAYALVFVYLGESLSEPRPGNILLALGLLLVLILVFWVVRRRIDGEVGDDVAPPPLAAAVLPSAVLPRSPAASNPPPATPNRGAGGD